VRGVGWSFMRVTQLFACLAFAPRVNRPVLPRRRAPRQHDHLPKRNLPGGRAALPARRASMRARRAGRRGTGWWATAAVPSTPGRARFSAGRLASCASSCCRSRRSSLRRSRFACQGNRLGRRERARRHARRRSSCCGAACAAATWQLGASTSSAAAPRARTRTSPCFPGPASVAAARPQAGADGGRTCAPAPDASCGSSKRLAAAMGGSGGCRVDRDRMPHHGRLAHAGTVAVPGAPDRAQPACYAEAPHGPASASGLAAGARRAAGTAPDICWAAGRAAARRCAKRRRAGAASAHLAQRLRAMVGEQLVEPPLPGPARGRSNREAPGGPSSHARRCAGRAATGAPLTRVASRRGGKTDVRGRVSCAGLKWMRLARSRDAATGGVADDPRGRGARLSWCGGVHLRRQGAKATSTMTRPAGGPRADRIPTAWCGLGRARCACRSPTGGRLRPFRGARTPTGIRRAGAAAIAAVRDLTCKRSAGGEQPPFGNRSKPVLARRRILL
jgi:hypothetical protein